MTQIRLCLVCGKLQTSRRFVSSSINNETVCCMNGVCSSRGVPCCIHPILFILSSNFVWSDLGHLLRICRNQLPRQHTPAPSLPALGQWKFMISYIYPSRVLVSLPVRCRCWFKVNVHGKYGILIISSNVPITTSLLCGFRAAQCRQPATLNISFFLKLMWRSSTFNFLCVKNVWFRQR